MRSKLALNKIVVFGSERLFRIKALLRSPFVLLVVGAHSFTHENLKIQHPVYKHIIARKTNSLKPTISFCCLEMPLYTLHLL